MFAWKRIHPIWWAVMLIVAILYWELMLDPEIQTAWMTLIRDQPLLQALTLLVNCAFLVLVVVAGVSFVIWIFLMGSDRWPWD
jgi:hypothetical protein